MHARRLLVAAIALPLFYVAVSQFPPYIFLALLLLMGLLGQWEFYAMYRTTRALSFLGIAAGGALLLTPLVPPYLLFVLYPLLFMLAFMGIATTRLFSIKTPSAALAHLAPALIGILYIPHLLLPQWFLRLRGDEWILFLYGCVWASDSAAYYVGKSIGKRKLYKEVSPNKTVAGGVGSVVGGALVGLLLGWLLMKEVAVPLLAVFGGVIGAVTIVGDLVESMFKRDAGVKDSGSLIPGHGGVLDKIDGVLFAGPVLYWMTLLL